MLIYVLMLAVAVIGSNSLLLSPILSDIANDFSTDPVAVVWAITAYNAVTAISALLLTRLIDKSGIYVALSLAYSALLVGTIISGVSGNLITLIIGQSIAGLGAGVSLPAIYSLAPLLAPSGQESKYVGRVLTGWSVALVLGVPVAAFMSEVIHWRAAYGFLCLIAAVTLVVLRGAKNDILQSQPNMNNDAPPSWSLFAPFKIAGASTLLSMNLLYMASFYGTYSFVGTHLRAAFGVSATEAGYAVFAYGLGFGLASFADSLIDRIGVRRTSTFVFITLTLIYFSMAIDYGTPFPFYLICLCWGFVNHLGLSAIITMLGELKTSLTGQLMGMNSVFTYVGGTLGTLAFGAVYADLGFGALAVTAALLIALLTIVFEFLVRRVRAPHSI
ncbi:MAG: MFS transporter [Litoreibacter sp.]